MGPVLATWLALAALVANTAAFRSPTALAWGRLERRGRRPARTEPSPAAPDPTLPWRPGDPSPRRLSLAKMVRQARSKAPCTLSNSALLLAARCAHDANTASPRLHPRTLGVLRALGR